MENNEAKKKKDVRINSEGKVLPGGLMNSPILKDNLIYKEASAASSTIHELLQHVRLQGLDWVPESFGIDSNGKHVLSYIEGIVPHDMPDWIWDDSILRDVAVRLRQWHDATSNFKYQQAKWLLENNEVDEVICHNDIAPYNCVFKDKKLAGFIDFDLCSPGSRIWDIAYSAYRFVPLLPTEEPERYFEISPFSKETMLNRLRSFLEEYSCGDRKFFYSEKSVIKKAQERLQALADWSKNYGLKTKNKEVMKNAEMYSLHAKWLQNLL
ncbi:MAG: aminoglycoside phosphotransferase family protein [bacterium]